MNKIIVLLVAVFLSACGGGGGSSSSQSEVTSADIVSLYSGLSTKAVVDQDNIEDFVRVLFEGADFSGPLSRGVESEKSSSVNSLPDKVNTIILRTVSAEIGANNRIAQRAVSESYACDSGTLAITGDVDENTQIGAVVLKYQNCVVDGVTLHGSVNFIVTKYNLSYDAIENATMNYKDIRVSENDVLYVASGTASIVQDFDNDTTTTVETTLYTGEEREFLLENFKTTESSSGVKTVSGNVYLDDHGYVVVSTESPLSFSYYDQYYPDTGAILVEGSNQVVQLTPQESGAYLQANFSDENAEVSQILIGDLTPFTFDFLDEEMIYGDVTDIQITLYLSDALDTSRSTLSDLTLMTVNGEVIPSEVTYSGGNSVSVIPTQALEYSTEYHLEVKGEWYSIYGTLLTDTTVTKVTTEDIYGPEIVSVTPASGTQGVPLNSSFVIEFNEDISSSVISADDMFLRIDVVDYGYQWVPTVTSISGNKLTVTPVQPLSYGEKYILTFDSFYSGFKDNQGNLSYNFSDSSWQYQAELYSQRIGLDSDVSYFDVDRTTNKLYALDQANKKVVIVNLTTDTVETSHSLLRQPSRFCIDSASDRIYFTTMNSSFIEEYRLSDFTLMASIPWSASSTGDEAEHYEIKCTADKLYVVDAEWAPQIYSIERNEPYTETRLSEIEGTGSLVINNDGDIYTWYQFGWSGYDYSKVLRFQDIFEDESMQGEGDEGTGMLLDESTIAQWEDYGEVDSSIYLDEVNNLLVNSRYVFNSLNLAQLIYDFGEEVAIAGADFTRSRVATLDELYSLDTYDKVMDLPIYDADRVIFDNDGDLYMLKNGHSSLYIIKEDQIP